MTHNFPKLYTNYQTDRYGNSRKRWLKKIKQQQTKSMQIKFSYSPTLVIKAAVLTFWDYLKQSVNDAILHPQTHNQKIEAKTWYIAFITTGLVILLNIFS